MTPKERALNQFMVVNGGERWNIPGDEAFEEGWTEGVKAVLDLLEREEAELDGYVYDAIERDLGVGVQ